MTTRRSFLGSLGAIIMSDLLPAGASAAPVRKGPKLFPFLFWHEDTIVIPMVVNGVKTAGILDTAAAVSVVDRSFAAQSGIAVTSTPQSLAGPGGAYRSSRTEPFQLSVADRIAAVDWAAVVDLSHVSRAMGRKVGFLLGQDILRRYAFDFRFDTRQFFIAPTAGLQGGSDLALLRLGPGSRGEPTLEIAVEDKPPIVAVIDSGNSNPLFLSAAYADSAGLTSRRSSTALSATANGVSTNRLISVRQIRMASLSVPDVPTEIYGAWTSNGPPANVGLPLLASRRLIFDFGQDRLWRSVAGLGPLRRDRSGLGLVAKLDRLRVVHVAAGSPAEAAGWRLNEEIIEIDGKPVDPSYDTGQLWRWRFRPAGTWVRLRMTDGSARQLRLQDYY